MAEKREEGRKEGRKTLLVEKIKKKMEKGKNISTIADELEEDIETINVLVMENHL